MPRGFGGRNVKKRQLYVLATLSLAAVVANVAPARASVRIGVGFRFGFPIYVGPCGPRYYYPYYPYYPYPAVYVQPAPVYVPAPVTVAPPPAPVAVAPPQPVYSAASSPSYANSNSETLLPQPRRADGMNERLGQLASSDERLRAEAVIQLGRMKARQAVDPIAATLAGDSSSMVRESAARALGLIGSSAGLPALEKAAQTDTDHDVRHSARFAIDVIQAGR
jgi:hypothetical protein